MASFNLGRIKGDKGDKGDMGPVGETGAKGDKGDRGERGTDGITPVFTVGETVTVSSGEEAYVELDSTDTARPVLSFRIPRGQDGKDASGDMLSAIYDSEGIKKDFYEYARALSENCLKTAGGNMGGSLKAAESPLQEGFVRNITVSHSLSANCAEGDICVVVPDPNAKKLGDCHAGSVVIIKEDGKEIPYILIAKEYHGENSVTLIRKDVFPYAACFDYSQRGQYFMSDIDVLLETFYKNLLPETLRRKLIGVEVSYNIQRHCFLLGEEDFSGIEFLQTESNRFATYDNSDTRAEYMLRTINSYLKVTCVNTTGEFSYSAQNAEKRFRPSFVLPADFDVENTVYDEAPAVKLPDKKCGIYVFINGEWGECAFL